jgi:hypothetical protein
MGVFEVFLMGEMLTLDTATSTHTATHSIWYCSNRLDPLFPTLPTTATHHCHSACHFHTCAAFTIFCHFSSFFRDINFSLNTATATLYLPPFEPPRSPLSNATTQPLPLPLPPLPLPHYCHSLSFLSFSVIFHHLSWDRHNFLNTATATLYLPPFEPPRSPLSNGTTQPLPLQPPLLPLPHVCRFSHFLSFFVFFFHLFRDINFSLNTATATTILPPFEPPRSPLSNATTQPLPLPLPPLPLPHVCRFYHFLSFFVFFFYPTCDRHISANTATATFYLVPFEPPRSPLSNATTQPLPPLPLLLPLPHISMIAIFCRFFSFFSLIFRPSYLGQYCHCHAHFTTIRTAPIPSFQRYHPTTAIPATLTTTATHFHDCHFLSFFFLFFHPSCDHHLSANTATATTILPPFEPPRSPLSNATTQPLPLPLPPLPLPHVCRFYHFLSFFVFFFTQLATVISRSILPLPHSTAYHSNRLTLLFPTLPPNHCHSTHSYIQVAITGESFCTSAKNGWSLIVRNVLRVTAVSVVSTFVLFLGKLFIVVVAVLACNEMLKAEDPPIRSFLLLLMAFFLA